MGSSKKDDRQPKKDDRQPKKDDRQPEKTIDNQKTSRGCGFFPSIWLSIVFVVYRHVVKNNTGRKGFKFRLDSLMLSSNQLSFFEEINEI